MIDVLSLSRIVGAFTLQKGLEYARNGAVLDVELTENPVRISGRVHGSAPVPYQVDVAVSLNGPTVLGLTGVCSCPVRMNCKHVVAVVINGLSNRGRNPAAVKPAWERSLSPLVQANEQVSPTSLVLGLQFELLSAVGDPVASSGALEVPRPGRLGIRPVQLGALGKWVRNGIGWSNLGYASYGRQRADPTQLDWFTSVAAVAGPSASRYYGATPAWIHLEESSGAAIWDLLARAADLGIPLIGSGRTPQPVSIAEEPADIVVDIVRRGADIGLEAVILAGNESDDAGPCLMLGEPIRALATWPADQDRTPLRERTVRLASFRTPPTRELVQLVTAGYQAVPPQDEQRFLGTYLPVLRQRVRIVSHDGSFEVPAPEPPRLWLTVAHLPGHRTDLEWTWQYAGADDRQPLWPRSRPAAFRDFDEERALVASLPAVAHHFEPLLERGRLLAETRLVGMDTVGFLADVLPALQRHSLLSVEIRGEAKFRAADGGVVIGISGEAAEGRDWFDLQIAVTVDGEEVALREVFLALAREQEFMILPSGTFFRLEAQRFEQLRKLIDEARLLQDGGGEKSLRVSRFQASLWDELQQLGIVDEQASVWHKSVSALIATGEIESQPVPERFAAELRPYQQEGYDWLSFLFDAGLGGILADDMGLGKTVQALALICRAVDRPDGSDPFLVVAPTSVVGNWRAEARKFAPHLKVVTVNETSSRRGVSITDLVAEADVVITSYALFRLEFDDYDAQRWAGLILDEAQFVKNHLSQGFKHAKQLSTAFKLAITGTPMENNLMELWSLFAITAPGLFGSPKRFGEYYQKPIEKHGENEKLAQLRRRIRPLMLRRTKDQVVKDLPAKQEQVIELDLNAKHQKVYQTHLQRERQKVLGLIGDMDKNRFAIFRSLTLLRQLSLDASLVDEKYNNIPSTKLDALMEQLDDVVAEGHRVLVFSQFTSFLGKVRDRLTQSEVEFCYLDGATRNRPEVLERFSTGTAPVFLISLKAGGFGLNLTEADYCILLDPWWNPATEAQAIDRAHRIGQTKTVMVYRLVAKGTIEEKVMALKEGKAKLFASVMSEDGAASSALTADDIRTLLS
ncbi:Superfamily II DNA or RNA helicase, SNF2 family [Nakamurella panacisegetis]|uniref:Superfamily II DNA or RNA helicase, SNF2 family n=1 Tax=Nakamurella panacisegetis TaxID=1090615 RepID=A0A1H0KU40_9ACTN|nr:DEAD/DEAH box helicase [Nakamurella panacisegetis]SDO59260.1 Superfamily II DNA or RNA helicase, SNF2 family [Nakamurella panacisegetis]